MRERNKHKVGRGDESEALNSGHQNTWSQGVRRDEGMQVNIHFLLRLRPMLQPLPALVDPGVV